MTAGVERNGVESPGEVRDWETLEPNEMSLRSGFSETDLFFDHLTVN
jgi:hypothetical protein